MKKMKKILGLVIVAVLMFGAVGALAACQPTDTFHVDIFYYNYSDAFISTVRKALEDRLGKTVDFTAYDGAGQQSTQTAQVEQAIAKGSDLLLVNIVDTGADSAAKDLVTKAKAAGIPIAFFNREPTNTIFSSDDWAKKNTAFIGTNYVQAGYMEGQMIYDYLIANEKSDGTSKFDVNSDNKIFYVMMRGEMNNNEAIARTLYSVLTANYLLSKNSKSYVLEASALNITTDTAAAPTGWKFQFDGLDLDLASAYTTYNGGVNPLNKYCVDSESKWSATNASKMMDTIKGVDANCFTNGKFEIAICNNDDMALGVVTSLQAADFNKPTKPTIPVFGVDATSAAREKITDGSMAGSIEQSNVAMAQVLTLVISNVRAGATTLVDFGTLSLVKDGAGLNMVRIPYGVVTK